MDYPVGEIIASRHIEAPLHSKAKDCNYTKVTCGSSYSVFSIAAEKYIL